jgi:TonB dependent receptor
MKTFFKKFSLVALFLFSTLIIAQPNQDLGSQVVNVIKPYTPTLADANKIKETPNMEEEVLEPKIPLTYKIFSFPVASTFIPSKGKAAEVEQETLDKGTNNYALLGVGNYRNINAEVFVTHALNDKEYIGALLQHISTAGGIKNTIVEDSFGKTSADITYGNRNANNQWHIDLGIGNQMINWFGLPLENIPFAANTFDNLKLNQSYNTISIAGNYSAKKDVFTNADILFKRFSDKFDSGENRFLVTPTFDIDFEDSKITTNLIADYVSGNFKNNVFNTNSIDYNSLIFGAKPSFLLLKDDFELHLGVGLFYNIINYNSSKENNFYIVPNIKATYTIVENIATAYAGAEGNVKQNSYADLVSQNPFVSPTLDITPTVNNYDIYAGLKGKLSQTVSFNVRANYINENNKAFFVSNTYNPTLATFEKYQYGNSFQVVYDNTNTISFMGELKADVSKKTNISLSGKYSSFNTDVIEKPFNVPQLEVNAGMHINLTDKWYAGTNIIFVGERNDLVSQFNINNNINIPAIGVLELVTLDSYLDLNLNVGYKHNKHITAFLRGNNLANQQYNRWNNYNVQGAQVMLGAIYKFDF